MSGFRKNYELHHFEWRFSSPSFSFSKLLFLVVPPMETRRYFLPPSSSSLTNVAASSIISNGVAVVMPVSFGNALDRSRSSFPGMSGESPCLDPA